MDFVDILVTWLVTASSLLILTKLPLGIEIDNPGIAYISAAVFGIINSLITFFVLTVPNFFTFGIYGFFAKVFTLGLFSFLINAIALTLARRFVTGFRLEKGIISAVFVAIALSLVSSLITSFVVGQPAAIA
ncbi:phage holin family protein [Planktothrix sp. FACHB-1355]|uniref:Phage holin family protein n=1 Tax=Aerosakkonema funiforme FACHB-1375 TaxID=2949571 RepID=A0A926VKJ5_9CYAN|nr:MULTISPECIES: phage holin family protein [Oscillatoriales]MBD2185521.1 phage holin family protein [Aerosakkonema funiforme FACHB-1375]MBD3563331.1 phage holin family protein [Planktothrix sp. FACHB-1355]